MTRRRWALAGVVAILLAGSGCVSCGHRGYRVAREVGAECELPACQRNHVYVFAVSSLNPVSVMALDALAEELNRRGFAKVATGQTVHTGWMAREMRRIHKDEPDAVFVVLGFESGTPAAVRLAEKAQAEGLPVGGLVVIDSEGKTPPPASAVRTLAIGNVQGMPSSESVESVVVPDAATYGLATDSRTVKATARLLGDLAAAVPMPVVVEAAEWDYPHAPPMRPAGDPSKAPEWTFLFDQFARVNRPAPTPTPAAPVQSASYPPTTVKSAVR